jgi:hypothetical protein
MVDAVAEMDEVEAWFLSQGHRLELELEAGRGWRAVVLPGRRPMGAPALLSATGQTQLEAALSAHDAFLQHSSVGD